MKIAIITLHRVFNYGSVLQAYATQKIFEELGYEVEIIDYITEQRTIKKLLFSIPESKNTVIKKITYLIFKSVSIFLKIITFGRFIRKYMSVTKKKYISYGDLVKNPPDADVYVTGSDQIWNSKYNEGIDKGFFLCFAPKEAKKISYASSFGKEKLDINEAYEIKKLLKQYSALSVREDTALKILNQLGFNNSICIIDPTLQIDKDKWSLITRKRMIREKYLLLMLLYNEDNGGTEYAQKIADEKNLKVVKISWEYIKPNGVDVLMTHRSPEVFLSLFKYADYIVTNSFHGMSFAINFNRQFIAIERNEFNTRLLSLLRLTHLENRLMKHNLDMNIVNDDIDYEKVNKILKDERDKSMDYLKSCL